MLPYVKETKSSLAPIHTDLVALGDLANDQGVANGAYAHPHARTSRRLRLRTKHRLKFRDRQPGTSTTFVDADSEESILHLASDADGLPVVTFRLYDSGGTLVADCDDLTNYPEGVTIETSAGEQLLRIPKDSDEDIQYRLYNHTGELLTSSDGVKTKIYSQLRMTGAGRAWVGRPKS